MKIQYLTQCKSCMYAMTIYELVQSFSLQLCVGVVQWSMHMHLLDIGYEIRFRTLILSNSNLTILVEAPSHPLDPRHIGTLISTSHEYTCCIRRTNEQNVMGSWHLKDNDMFSLWLQQQEVHSQMGSQQTCQKHLCLQKRMQNLLLNCGCWILDLQPAAQIMVAVAKHLCHFGSRQNEIQWSAITLHNVDNCMTM